MSTSPAPGRKIPNDDALEVGNHVKNLPQEDAKPTPPAMPTFPEGGSKAWGVVLGCWCTSFASFGIVNSFGVYETYYLQTFLQGHSPSTVAWIGSIQAFAQFSATLASGPLTDRYGPMVILWPFSILLVVAMMLTSLCTELYQFILCQGVLLGISCGLIFAPALAVIGHYFFNKRALTMSLASTGSPVGGIIFPVVLNNLIPSIGFAWAQRVCGFLSLALLLVAAVFIRPTGMRRKNSLFLLGAFAKPAYYLQVAALFMVVLGLWTPYFYIATYGIEHGMSVRLANYLFALINAGSFVGRVSGGFLASWVGQFNVITASCYISAILLFVWLGITSTTGLIVLAILFGASSGIIIALMMSTIAHTADHPSKIGTYIGQSTFVVGFAGLAGTPITGGLISQHGFSAGITFSAAVILVGAVLITGARYTFAPNKLNA